MAHTFDTSLRIPVTGTAITNPLVANYTCGAGASVLVLMLMYAGAVNRAGGAPTYGGVALVPVGVPTRALTAPECTVEMWLLLNPSNNLALPVSIPNTGGVAMKAVVASAKSATGASFIHGKGAANATGTNPTTDLTTTSPGCVLFAVVANGATTWAPSARSGVQIMDEDFGAWGGGAQYFLQPAAGLKTMSWTFPTAEDYGLIVVALREGRPSLPVPDNARLTTKLQAIQSKNVDEIHAKNVYIPFLGVDYTKEQLQTWLDTRATELQNSFSATSAQIDTKMVQYYEALPDSDKLIADAIINGLPYELGAASNAAAYDKLVAIALAIFVTRI